MTGKRFVIDSDGITATFSTLNIVVDSSAPLAPNTLEIVSGLGSQRNFTRSTTPTIRGRAEAGLRVQLYRESQLLGETTADSSGVWQIQASPLAEGIHSLTAIALDPAGNETRSGVFLITVDTIAPIAPSSLELVGGTSSTMTWSLTPTIRGKAEPGLRVRLYRNGEQVGETTADHAGDWQIQFSTLNGTFSISAIALDQADNASASSSVFAIVVNNMPVPTALELVGGVGAAAKLTRSATPTIRGKAEPRLRVRLYREAQLLGESTSNDAGDWQIQSSPLAEGEHSLSAIAVDAVGNTSASSQVLVITIDLTPPAAPTFGLLSGTQGIVTNSRTPILRGMSEVNSTVELWLNTERIIGYAIADQAGKWQARSQSSLEPGQYLVSAFAIDQVGNRSGRSAFITLVIDPSEIPEATVQLAQPGKLSGTVPVTRIATLQGRVTKLGSEVRVRVERVADEPPSSIAPARIVDLVPLVQADGSYQLENSELSDGEYQVFVETPESAETWQTLTSAVFRLDTTPPVISLDRLFDGDAWYLDELLKGNVQDRHVDRLICQFEDNAVQEIQLSEAEFEVLRPGHYKAGELRTLEITAIDLAGNEVKLEPIQFLVPLEFIIKDEETGRATPPEDEDEEPNNPGGGGGTVWINRDREVPSHIGGGGLTTYEIPHSLTGGNAYHTPNSACKYVIDYVTKIEAFAENAVPFVTNLIKSLALENRINFLGYIASMVSSADAYEGMRGVMYDLFVNHHSVCVNDDETLINDGIRRIAIGDGGLAIAINQDPQAFRLRAFQAALVAAVNLALQRVWGTTLAGRVGIVPMLRMLALHYAGL
ncbi:MAG: Ig-like domain-containing protein, partial [Leptolyngbya sp. Prado105]|nr:Ig-like domain-containing protein [Leptolyngbya sp. Prado105]